jgi:hypothetical protein
MTIMRRKNVFIKVNDIQSGTMGLYKGIKERVKGNDQMMRNGHLVKRINKIHIYYTQVNEFIE